MVEKKYCDVCGEEIKTGYYLWGARYHLYGNHLDKDFCSIKCLKKFVLEELK